MAFQIERGVEQQKYGSGKFIGVYFPDTPHPWKCGAYEFSNVHSANMYSYLFRSVNPKIAKEAVIEFETKLTGSDAKKDAFKTIIGIVDWKTAATGNVPAALLGTLKNAISTATDLTLGYAVKQALMGTAKQFNPFPAVLEGPLWASDKVRDQYIEYAIGYWKKNPLDGPAYMSSAETVKPVKK